ncbi:response regulator, partial [Opitutales bacterium]|nr:response regulator [Opitutales bacterium]
PNDNMGSIECSIIDTGIGISKSDQKRLFQVFTQVDSSTTRQYNGVGLGLAITKRLCEILGGSIKLKSEPSVGSTFHFSIPVHSNAELECAPLPTSIKRIIPPIINSDLKTLIVEDNSINAKLLSAQLKKIGHSSEIVYNSTECIEYMKNHDYDIIFMDLNMPEMDGFELTARIREQESSSNKTDVPQSIIIAVSAWAMTGMKERCIEAGMDGYLSKPIIREELSKLVEELSSER